MANLFPGAPPAPRLGAATLRQTFRISLGGSAVRVRLSNALGEIPLPIGAASIARVRADGSIDPATLTPLTFGGATSASAAPGAPLLSDAALLAVPDNGSVAITLYLPAAGPACSCHPTEQEATLRSPAGDFTRAATMPVAERLRTRAFVAGIEVRPAGPAGAIVALGDSITDGAGSSGDGHRWIDRLADRLAARGTPGATRWGVVDAGIGGNRLVSHGIAENALARFDRDVLSVPGVRTLILFEGINDIGFSALTPPPGFPVAEVPRFYAKVDAAGLIDAYRQIVVRAHAAGITVVGATITPFRGATYFSEGGEQVRQQVNAWIRTPGSFDHVVDFDAAWRDPADPSRLRAAFTADSLHGNDAGYAALGDAFDLAVFR